MPIHTSEELVGMLPVGVIPDSLVLSADSRHFACVAVESGKIRVVYDGVSGPLYKGIHHGTPILSPDGKHFAYVAQKEETEVVVLDGVEGPEFGSVVEDRLCFSPNSQRLAYVGFQDGKMVSVVDGEVNEAYDWIFHGPSFFSPDSQSTCFVGTGDGTISVVTNGIREALPDIDGIRQDTPIFSPHSKRVAFVAQSGGREAKANAPQGLVAFRGGQSAVFCDGVKHAFYDEVPPGLHFSPDGSRFGYIGIRNGQAYLNLDGKESGPFDALAEEMPIFSPDGSRLAYSFQSNGQFVVMVDGIQCGPYRNIGAGTPIFSPDSQHIAFVIPRGLKAALVLDGQERVTKYRYIQKHAFAFSPDSQRIAFAARTGLLGLKGCVEVDGEPGPTYLAVGLNPPVFSANSQRVAYMALNKWNRAFAVVDGQEGEPCNKFVDGTLRFSPDGRFVVYLAQINGKAVIMIDGIAGEKGSPVSPEEGTIIRGSNITFNEDGSFHFLTLSPQREIKIMKVSVTAS